MAEKKAKEKTVRIQVVCPARLGLHGFWSAQKLWPEGVSEHEVPESLALALLDEIERGVSILKVKLLEDEPAVAASEGK